MTAALLRGFLLALALILPLGPQNAFILSQGAAQPRLRLVLPIVVTAALSDTFLILLAVTGVSLALGRDLALRLGLQAAGAIFLLYIGAMAWRHAGSGRPQAEGDSWTLGRKVRYSLSVSLLNPHAILDTLFVIGSGGAIYAGRPERWAYALGAVLVSWLFFLALAILGGLLRRAGGGERAARLLSRASGILLIALGIGLGWQVALALR